HLLLPLVLFVAGCATPTVHNTLHTFTTVVVDPGHGGKDSGVFKNRVAEKIVALDTAQRLAGKLRAAGFRVVMTRDSDRFIELNDRAAISNKQRNAVFVSVHFNDGSRRAHGAQVYWHSNVSQEFAQRIENKLGEVTMKDGVPHANFRVLRLNQYPAVLVECGFISNRREARRCADTKFREQLAQKIAEGIIEERGA